MPIGPDKTARSAEYPPALSMALAAMVLTSCQNWMDPSAAPLDGDVPSLHQDPANHFYRTSGIEASTSSAPFSGSVNPFSASARCQNSSAGIEASTSSVPMAGPAKADSASPEGQNSAVGIEASTYLIPESMQVASVQAQSDQAQGNGQASSYTKWGSEAHKALRLFGAGNAEVEGFFVTAPGHEDVCVEVRAAEHGNSTSEEDEEGMIKPLKYHGRLGRGKPVMVTQAGKRREFQDRAGICSPGRWRPRDRQDCALAADLRRALLELLDGKLDVLGLARRLASWRPK